MLLRYGVEFFGFVLLARVFLVFIVVPSVVDMPFADACFVAN